MVKIKIEGAAKLDRALKKFDKVLNRGSQTFLEDAAIAGTRTLAQQTEPYGLAGKSKKVGEKATAKDIAKVYSGIGRTVNRLKEKNVRMAAAFSKAVENGDYDAAEKIARRTLGKEYDVGDFDGGSMHEAARNSKGRVTGEGEKLAVVDQEATPDYHDEKRKRVGFAKAGWVSANQKLRGKTRFQKWLKRHAAPSAVVKRLTGLRKHISVTNKVRYVSNVLTENKVKRAATRAIRNTLRSYQKKIDAAAKRV